VADYLAACGAAFELPLQVNTPVTVLRRSGGGFRLGTTNGTYTAGQVMVASGAYQAQHSRHYQLNALTRTAKPASSRTATRNRLGSGTSRVCFVLVLCGPYAVWAR
jgi:glycine/D-amino acid oxidase-like deaminating enzyme